MPRALLGSHCWSRASVSENRYLQKYLGFSFVWTLSARTGERVGLKAFSVLGGLSILAWRIPGTGEPGGLPSRGSHRVGH